MLILRLYSTRGLVADTAGCCFGSINRRHVYTRSANTLAAGCSAGPAAWAEQMAGARRDKIHRFECTFHEILNTEFIHFRRNALGLPRDDREVLRIAIETPRFFESQ